MNIKHKQPFWLDFIVYIRSKNDINLNETHLLKPLLELAFKSLFLYTFLGLKHNDLWKTKLCAISVENIFSDAKDNYECGCIEVGDKRVTRGSVRYDDATPLLLH